MLTMLLEQVMEVIKACMTFLLGTAPRRHGVINRLITFGLTAQQLVIRCQDVWMIAIQPGNQIVDRFWRHAAAAQIRPQRVLSCLVCVFQIAVPRAKHLQR